MKEPVSPLIKTFVKAYVGLGLLVISLGFSSLTAHATLALAMRVFKNNSDVAANDFHAHFGLPGTLATALDPMSGTWYPGGSMVPQPIGGDKSWDFDLNPPIDPGDTLKISYSPGNFLGGLFGYLDNLNEGYFTHDGEDIGARTVHIWERSYWTSSEGHMTLYNGESEAVVCTDVGVLKDCDGSRFNLWECFDPIGGTPVSSVPSTFSIPAGGSVTFDLGATSLDAYELMKGNVALSSNPTDKFEFWQANLFQIPEPSTALLLGAGAVALLARLRRVKGTVSGIGMPSTRK